MKTTTTLSLFAVLLTFTVNAQDPAKVTFTAVDAPLSTGDLPMTATGQQVWGDFNNDGLLDIFITAGQSNPSSVLYKNNGNGTFTEILTDITSLAKSSAVFFDYDNDGNLDLLISGSADGSSTATLTELYHNTGAPKYEFVLNEKENLVGISSEGNDNSTRLLEAVDYNNDGWVDIFMSGNAGSTWDVSGNSRVVALYKNDHGTFKLQTTPVDGTSNFTSMNGGGIHCGDVNNDGYVDMIVSGYVDGTVQTATDLYINKGDGTFSYYADSRSIFTGQTQGETFFADINNDGWLDIVEIGRDVNNSWASFSNLFINKHDLKFTKLSNSKTNLIGGDAVVAVGDINNDGLVDLAVSGWGPNTTFFYNKGDSSFLTSPIDPDKARARGGCTNFVDIDKDGNLDFTIFGYRDGGDGTPENPSWPDYLLINNISTGDNKAPSIPTNFLATQNGEDVVLTWNKSTDDFTPANAIRYNVFAKSKTGTEVYTYFPSNTTTGELNANINGVRPLLSGTSFTLKGKSIDSYTFGVQAIDNANKASEFATNEIHSAIQNVVFQNISVFSHLNTVVIKNKQNVQVSYKITSISGNEVSNGICHANNSETISIPQPGVYIVLVSDKISTKVEKVIIY